MEEKERYELFGKHCIKDNSPNARPQLLDDYVSCVILNEQDQKIKELQQQLAEHNEFFNAFNCKNFNEFKDFISTFMLTPHEEQTLIIELKQQLAEKEKEETKRMEDFEKGCQEYYKSNQTEIAELKNQLAEKDELLKQKIGDMKSTDFIKMCISCGFMVEAKENDNQTAIAELEKVKEWMNKSDDDGYIFRFASMDTREKFNQKLDQQIKLLKGDI